MIALSCPDVLFPVEELPSALPALKSMGFVAVDLAWVGSGIPAQLPIARRTTRIASDAGLQIGAVWVYGITGACSSVRAIRRSAIERMTPFFELAVESNAAGVVTIDHCLDAHAPPSAYDEALPYLRESFSEMGRVAEAVGTRVFIEPLSRPNHPLLDTIDSAVDFCRSLGPSCVRVCADTYHARVSGEDFGASLASAKESIGFVHFSDFCAVAGQPDRPLPSFGEIDFNEAYRSVMAIGYAGVVAIEGTVPDGISSLEACGKIARRLSATEGPTIRQW